MTYPEGTEDKLLVCTPPKASGSYHESSCSSVAQCLYSENESGENENTDHQAWTYQLRLPPSGNVSVYNEQVRVTRGGGGAQ